VLVQLRDEFVADVEGFNGPEDNTAASALARVLLVRRSPQAMACRKRGVEELGKPQRLLLVGKTGAGYAGIETRKGKPGHRISLKPKPRDGEPERQAEKYCQRESPPHAVGVSYQA
jgi:hypothetical protein